MLRIQMILVGMLLGAIWLPLHCQSEQTGWNPLPRAMVVRRHTSASSRWQNAKNYAEVRKPSDILPSRQSLETNYQYGVNSGEAGSREGGSGSDNHQNGGRGGSDFVRSGYRYSYTTGGEPTYYGTTPPMNNIREYANGFSYENPYNHGGTTAQPPTFEFGNAHAVKGNAETSNNYNEAKPNDGRNAFDVKPAKSNGNNGPNGFNSNSNADNVYDAKTNNHNAYSPKHNVNNGNVAKPNGFEANPSVPNAFSMKPSAPNAFNMKPNGPNGYDVKPIIYNPILPTVRPLFYGDFRGNHAQKGLHESNKDNKDYEEPLHQRDPDYNGEDFNEDNENNDDNGNEDYDPKSHESEEIFNDGGNDNYIDGQAEPDKPQFRPNDKPLPFRPNENDKPLPFRPNNDKPLPFRSNNDKPLPFRPNNEKPPFRPNIMPPHQGPPPQGPLPPPVPSPPTFPTNRPQSTDYFEVPKHVGHIIPLFTPSSSPQPHLQHEPPRDHRPPSYIVPHHPMPPDIQLTPPPSPHNHSPPHPSQPPPLPQPPRAPEEHQHHEEPYMHLFQGPTPSNNDHREHPHNSNNDHRELPHNSNNDHREAQQPNYRNPPSEQQHHQNTYQENLQDPNGIDDSFFMLAMKVVHNTLFYGDMNHRNRDNHN